MKENKSGKIKLKCIYKEENWIPGHHILLDTKIERKIYLVCYSIRNSSIIANHLRYQKHYIIFIALTSNPIDKRPLEEAIKLKKTTIICFFLLNMYIYMSIRWWWKTDKSTLIAEKKVDPFRRWWTFISFLVLTPMKGNTHQLVCTVWQGQHLHASVFI